MMRARTVDPHVPRLDARGKAMRAIEIVRPDRRRQAVVERVDAANDVVLVRPAKNADHGPEDFLARDPHVVAHVGEHRRLDEIPVREPRIAWPVSTVNEACALLLAAADVAPRLVVLRA